jgi:hypothetical protein
MDNLSSGLRSGAAIGGMIKGGMDTSAVQNAAQRIQAGENQQAVISELMAQSPQAAQQLMNLLGGQQNLDAGATEIEALKTKVGMQSLQQAALPIFGALQVDDDGARGKLLNEAAAVFEKQSPETAAVIRQIGGLQGKQQFDAVAGIVKSLRSAGVFPDDPSQLQQSTALGQNLSLYDQAIASGDMERAELIKRNIDPSARAFAQNDARVNMEQSLNPIIAAREAGKIGAVEQTATGGAQLAQEQQAVAKGERELSEAKRAKENAAAAINSQLQQIQRLESHPGFESAVGLSSIAPSVRGSEAYGFEKQLEKLDAQSFMAMIPNLAGMGALSNAEGQKVSAALSALNTGLSEEEFRAEMKVIRETLMQARDRLKTGNTLPPEQAAPAASTVGRFKIEVQ